MFSINVQGKSIKNTSWECCMIICLACHLNLSKHYDVDIYGLLIFYYVSVKGPNFIHFMINTNQEQIFID